EQAGLWTDDEVFECFLFALLSNSTDWTKVEGILPELRGLLHRFSIHHYSALTKEDISETVVPWFKARKAGSLTLKKGLTRLAESARLLLVQSAIASLCRFYSATFALRNLMPPLRFVA